MQTGVVFIYRRVGVSQIGSAHSGMTTDLHTPLIQSAMQLEDDDSDWLHRNWTYVRDMRFIEKLQNVSSSAGFHGMTAV